MIERVLPTGGEAAEHTGPPRPVPLHPSEEPGVANAVPHRRAEYAAVPAGPDRAPVWPAGIVGSMTHVDGYRAAAVGRAETWVGIGIDAEEHAPLPPGVETLVMSQDELTALARTDPALCPDRVLFSAKESVYKVWYPVTRSWLGFEDVDVRLGDGTFTARIGRTGLGTDVLHGRWAVGDGLVVTAVALARA